MTPQHNVLLVTDDVALGKYLCEELSAQAGCTVWFETGWHVGIEVFRRNPFDIVVAELGMPDVEDFEINRTLKHIDADCVVIGYLESENLRTLSSLPLLGLYDYITKPVNAERLAFMVKKGIELHGVLVTHRRLSHGLQEQNLSLQKQNSLLAKRIEDSTKNLARLYDDLRSTYLRTIKAFAQAIDARDHYTHSHSLSVAKYAVEIASQMRFSMKDIEVIREACELHDLGKIGVNDSILSKPARLTAEEWAEMKKHPLTAAQILQSLPFLDGVAELVKQHHEHYDGSGYPGGLKATEILAGARIIHLADAYEAMRTPRAYRPVPLLKQEAIEEIKRNAGKQFDPEVVEEFLKIADKLEERTA